MRYTRRRFLPLVLASAAHAQTMAHPGWRGNGIATEAWWWHTAIVRLGSDTTFAQAAAVMDNMSAAGVDTMLLPDLLPEPSGALPFAERFGSEDNLNALLREASARRMHVLLTAPLLRLAGHSGEVRFWMTRGIAGFDVGAITPFELDTLLLLRAAVDRFPGQRLLLVRTDAPFRALRGRPVLRVTSAREDGAQPSFASDLANGPMPENLTTGSVPIIDAAMIQTEYKREQVRKMLAAHRGTAIKPEKTTDSLHTRR